MAWIAEGRIDYVLPKIDSNLSCIPSQFDPTFYFRQNTSISPKRKQLSVQFDGKATRGVILTLENAANDDTVYRRH